MPSAAALPAAEVAGELPPREPARSQVSGRRVRLSHLLFLGLLLSGIIPLAISSALLIRQNRSLLVEQEREHLLSAAAGAARQVDTFLQSLRREITQRGVGLLALPGPDDGLERLRQPWVRSYFTSMVDDNSSLLAVQAIEPGGQGVWFGPEQVSAPVRAALEDAYQAARDSDRPVYRLVADPRSSDPLAVLAVPVHAAALPAGEEPAAADGAVQTPTAALTLANEMTLVIEGLSRLRLRDVVRSSGTNEILLLMDGEGNLLWSEGGDPLLRAAGASAPLVRELSRNPVNFTAPFEAEVAGVKRQLEATGSRIAETGWSVVVLKPMTSAFAAVSRMIYRTLLISLLLVALAALFALVASRWVGRPVQRLAATSHEIAAGNFGHRVDTQGLTFEMADLADNFNLMGEHVESYVRRLQRAADANRELFIGSIRAFAAAIDAKDPYTRGHSERVAAVSRAIADSLSLEPDFQHQVWLGALLHDVGKLGVDDRILKKGGLLTPEEFDQMKLHTVIGAEIMERIEQLREIVPAIRWHHENWNGRGYPDGLRGDEIPLIARIIAVADTFDAVTTSRPYQQAYTLEFAVETITKLTGTRFDAKITTAFLKAFHRGSVENAIHRAMQSTEEMEASAVVMTADRLRGRATTSPGALGVHPGAASRSW
jgi:putative nucleotidyltransferase with HDIG domain